MQTFMRGAALVSLAFGLIASAKAESPDPLLGTWKLNVAKSKFNPGPAPKSSTVTYEAIGQDVKATTDGVDGDGTPIHTEYTASYDGKDHPIPGAPSNTLSLRRIDANTTERIDKLDGKVVSRIIRKVDPSGKVLTITQKGTTADGKAFENTLVYEKE